MAPSRRSHWAAIVGVILSLGLLAWALRGTDAARLLAEVRAARPLPLLLAVALATAAFPIRLMRWRLLLRADDGGVLPAAPLWHAIALGFMANNILPFRAGELVRSYAGARLTHTRLSAAIASIAIERVFDGLFVVGLLVIALFTTHLPSTIVVGGASVSLTRAATTAGIISLLALLGAVAVVAWPAAAARVMRTIVRSPRAADAAGRALDGIRHGMAALRSPRRAAAVAAWSLCLWLVNAASFWVAFHAFGLPVDFAGALVLQGLLVIGIALPSTPGFVGVFEAVIGAVLLIYGVEASRGVAYALVYHAATFVPITLLGLWSLSRTGLSLSDVRKVPVDA